MKELKITSLYALFAILFVFLAYITTPKKVHQNIFEEGQLFYPDFKDPLSIASIEIYEKNELGTLKSFKAECKDKRWIIPTHHNYPTDVKDRLGLTASALIDLRKDVIHTDNPKDHEKLGVIDPLDTKATITKGFGKRVIIKNFSGATLADFIIGKKIEGHSDKFYIRTPDSKRVYAVKISNEISSNFEDWVETDLLKVSSYDITEIEFNLYKIDEVSGRLSDIEHFKLIKKDNDWQIKEGLKEQEEINKERVDEIVNTLDDLKIVDVRPKQKELAELTDVDWQKLTSKQFRIAYILKEGFFITSKKQLLSNEGEMRVKTNKGAIFILRFGEIVVSEEKKGDSRYLFIAVNFDESVFPQIELPKDTKEDGSPKTEEEKKKDTEDFENKKKERDKNVEDGKKFVKEMSYRFADWFYIVADTEYKKLRKTRNDVVKLKQEEKKEVENKQEEKKQD